MDLLLLFLGLLAIGLAATCLPLLWLYRRR